MSMSYSVYEFSLLVFFGQTRFWSVSDVGGFSIQYVVGRLEFMTTSSSIFGVSRSLRMLYFEMRI